MQHAFPLTIQNKYGERITFLGLQSDKLLLEAFCEPKKPF